MDADQRHTEIPSLLREAERVSVDDLSARFGVSNQTVRADLRDLSNRGLVTRTHGGAVRVDQVSNREYAERRKVRGAEKEAMGALCASMIPDNCSVSLNIGTSTEQVAKALGQHKDLTVLSNNINIINILIGTPSKELILVGGAVRQSDGAIVGEDAVEFIERYKVDYAIIGASALDADGSVLDYDAREVSVARAILRNSRIKILVCDSSKFDRSAPIRICALQDLDYVVTDQMPPLEFIEAARLGQTEILVLDEAHAH